MHASIGAPVAAAVLLDEFKERGRAVICEITEPAPIRKRFECAGIVNRLHHARREDGPRGIDAFLRDLADYSACGVPERDLRRLAIHVEEFMDALFPIDPANLAELDVVEQQLEGVENDLTTRRLVTRETSPTDLEAAAHVDLRHAAAQTTRARVLRHEASRLRFAFAHGGKS